MADAPNTYPASDTGAPYASGEPHGPINPGVEQNTARGVTEAGVTDDRSTAPYAGGTKPASQGGDTTGAFG